MESMAKYISPGGSRTYPRQIWPWFSDHGQQSKICMGNSLGEIGKKLLLKDFAFGCSSINYNTDTMYDQWVKADIIIVGKSPTSL